MNRESAYFNSPRLVQEALSNAAGLGVSRKRYSASYLETEAEYEARSSWTPEELHAFTLARRTQSLALASQTPHYSKLFREMGAAWHELVEAQAFAQIPITTKSQLRACPQDFSPRPRMPADQITRTSGTTGSSIEVPRSQLAVDEQWAVWWRYRGWHGIHRGEPCALFAGRRIMRADQGAPYWRSNAPGHELRFSTYHISPATAPDYVKRLNKFAPRWIHGFSSAIANLASCILTGGLRVTAPIRWITLGGENVTPLQMKQIEEAFGAHPVQHYGLAEGAANFSTCQEGQLHVDEDFAGIEFVPTPSRTNQILGTTYANTARVLLRYDTGDLARLGDPTAACNCGFGGRIVLNLDGRGDETLLLPDGRMIGSPEDAFRNDHGIAQAQIIQRANGALSVHFIRSSTWTDASLTQAETALRAFVGHEISIDFEEVDSLQLTSSGKVRLVIKEGNPEENAPS